MRKIFILFLLIVNQLVFSQFDTPRGIGGNLRGLRGDNRTMRLDSVTSNNEVEYDFKTHYTDYKIINYQRDTIVVDTTLTMKKYYRFNFLRKDNFELLEFHNQGQTFNKLAYDINSFELYPDIGFKAKQFGYYGVEDVKYYRVPTPTSEILAKTGLQQGQVLDALFTTNFKPNLNFSVAYKGLRSLGHYRESLSSGKNFRATISYGDETNVYGVRFHYANQDLLNQESGGLSKESLNYFISDDENFSDRSRLDVNLANTESLFKGKRIFINHNLKILSNKGSVKKQGFSNLKLGHQFIMENKEFSFKQSQPNEVFFGSAVSANALDEVVKSKLLDNQAYLEFNSKYVLGRFKVKTNFVKSTYGYEDPYNNKVNTKKIEAKALTFGAEWKGKVRGFSVFADGTLIPGKGALAGNYLKANARYRKDSLAAIELRLSQVTKHADYSYQLLRSAYDKYNWSNSFDKVTTTNLGGTISSSWGSVSADFSSILDHVYFDKKSKPQQYGSLITYFKVKGENDFKYGIFGMSNTFLYQEITSGGEVFKAPRFVTRNSIYYFSDSWFKGKPLYVNIGLTFKYFSKYQMNAYNPILAEFRLQDSQNISFPSLDLFFNARVQRTRLFFIIDNVSSAWSSKDYFSAPGYPYRDFTIRFGVVWNWYI